MQIPKANNMQDTYGQEDIFDLLTGSDATASSVRPVEKNLPEKNEYILALNVSVNNKKFNDAEAKAKRFLDYVRELESFWIKNTLFQFEFIIINTAISKNT